MAYITISFFITMHLYFLISGAIVFPSFIADLQTIIELSGTVVQQEEFIKQTKWNLGYIKRFKLAMTITNVYSIMMHVSAFAANAV